MLQIPSPIHYLLTARQIEGWSQIFGVGMLQIGVGSMNGSSVYEYGMNGSSVYEYGIKV